MNRKNHLEAQKVVGSDTDQLKSIIHFVVNPKKGSVAKKNG